MKRTQPVSTRSRTATRRAAAAVEFALVAPLFTLLALGTAELGRALDVSTNLTAAVREGGRLASMHHNGIVPPGMTTNDKVIQDIRNVLTAYNPAVGTAVVLELTHPDGPLEGQPFDLDDPDNATELFKIRGTVAYAAVSLFPLRFLRTTELSAEIVFRLGQSDLTQ